MQLRVRSREARACLLRRAGKQSLPPVSSRVRVEVLYPAVGNSKVMRLNNTGLKVVHTLHYRHPYFLCMFAVFVAESIMVYRCSLAAFMHKRCQCNLQHTNRLLYQNPPIKDNLRIVDKGRCTNLSFIRRFHYIQTSSSLLLTVFTVLFYRQLLLCLRRQTWGVGGGRSS